MTVAVLFALVGGVILVGFLANLLFRLTKIPSVLLLIATGIALGPLTGLVRSDALPHIAPFLGAVALLVILFEGGLELEIAHVVRQAPRTALLAAGVFVVSLAGTSAVARLLLGLPTGAALMLGAVLGATSPAICLPVVSGVSVRDEVKTIVKLESVIGEVLLIVTVTLLMESHATGESGAWAWIGGFSRSLLVALLVSSIAGALWSRLVGWMGREPLAYMLTLGVVFLLYFAVEELGGSTAIAILLFGLILANMQTIASRIGPKLGELFGVDVRKEQFVIDQFMVRITAELSFLVRTFFFVYLGLILDFSRLSWSVAGAAVVIFGLLLLSRRAGIGAFARRAGLSPGELHAIMALQPRGLATAVVALLPAQAGVPGTELFPVFAFAVITLSNLYMTGGVLFAERRLRLEARPLAERATAEEAVRASDEERVAAERGRWGGAGGEAEPVAGAVAAGGDARPGGPPLLSPAGEFAGEPAPASFTDWMARLFGLHLADREAEYAELVRASYFSEPLFWVQSFLGAAISALGLILNQTAVVIGGALIVPLARPVVACGLALASGDIYLLVRLVAKILGFGAMALLLSAAVGDALPFGAATAEITARIRPTVLDFLVALFGGMSGAALIPLRRSAAHYLPGAVIAITLLPALCVMGFGLSDGAWRGALVGGGLQFTANLFAAVLGASAVLTAVGLPRAAQSESIRRWKEQEFARPVVHALFGRLRLQNAIGRTGSLRARLIVVGLFLLLLLIPLQTAFDHLALELRTRQAVAKARALFDVAGRSAVVASSFSLGADDLEVRIQVATNEPFGIEDIARFEERVFDQVGRRARLSLVQTFSDVGQADALRSLLFTRDRILPPEPARSPVEALRASQELFDRAAARLPVPDSVRMLGTRASVGSSGDAGVELGYMADAELTADARAVLAGVLAERIGVAPARVVLRWVPSSVRLRVSGSGSIEPRGEAALAALKENLASWSGLAVSFDASRDLSTAAIGRARGLVREALGVEDLPDSPDAESLDRRTVAIRLKPLPSGERSGGAGSSSVLPRPAPPRRAESAGKSSR